MTVSQRVYFRFWWTKWKVKQNFRSESNETEINIDYVLILSRRKPSNFACFYKRIERALFCWLQVIVSPRVYIRFCWTKWKVKQNTCFKTNEIEINIDYVLILSRTKTSNIGCFYKRIETVLFFLTLGDRISMSLYQILMNPIESKTKNLFWIQWSKNKYRLCINFIENKALKLRMFLPTHQIR